MLEKILKILNIIDSCKTLDQLDDCLKMINNFNRDLKPQDTRIMSDLNKYYIVKLRQLTYLESL